MDAVRNLKVNLKVSGKPCRACQVPLVVAEDASVCTACEAEHHRGCWDKAGGCATPGCVNAPLKQLDPQVGSAAATAAPQLAPGMMACRSCRNVIPTSELLCTYCRAITSPDGIYHGPKTNAPGAVSSLVIGIVGLFLCGVIAGPVAISRSRQATREIAANPAYGGQGFATAGMVMGIIDLIAWAIVMVMRASAHG